MRKMSKKGFYDTLNYVSEKQSAHYNEILNHLVGKKIIDSRVSVPIILKGLTDLKLLERIVTNTRPVRTRYQLSLHGQKILGLLNQLEYSHRNLVWNQLFSM